jgi:hypothetical protein
MPNFQLSITNPVTEAADIAIASGTLTVVDHSNYSTSDEVGHLKADFSAFYKVLFTSPSGDETLFSSLGDGDETVTTPSSGDPEVAFEYTEGDGQYFVTIYSVPTYDAAAAYVYSVNNPVYVYYNEEVYKNIQSGTGQIADDEYWTLITDLDTLPSKYRLSQRIVVYADAKKTYARRIYNANCVNNLIDENWEKLLKDPEVINAIKLFIGINAIPVLLEASRYDDIDTTINNMKLITSNYETL